MDPKIYKALPTDDRHTFKPIGRPEIYQHYKLQEALFWTVSKVESDL
jgi:hypothetical protein